MINLYYLSAITTLDSRLSYEAHQLYPPSTLESFVLTLNSRFIFSSEFKTLTNDLLLKLKLHYFSLSSPTFWEFLKAIFLGKNLTRKFLLKRNSELEKLRNKSEKIPVAMLSVKRNKFHRGIFSLRNCLCNLKLKAFMMAKYFSIDKSPPSQKMKMLTKAKFEMLPESWRGGRKICQRD